MSAVDDLVTWLRAHLDDDERVAIEASRHRHGDGHTSTGEHWHWVEPEHDQVLPLDPMLDDYLNEGGRAALRSVEEYPTSMPYTLPHFVASYCEEVRTVDAMHIARWDPARVLAEIDAKRAILDRYADAHWHAPTIPGATSPILQVEDTGACRTCVTVRLLALPYADRPGYREEWRP